MNITVQVYKPSGKWYMDEEVEIPTKVDRLHLLDYIANYFYQENEYKWLLVIHPGVQETKQASDFVAFPQAYNLKNF